jgi:asparagine synthase (glutamine-hydrolysing)
MLAGDGGDELFGGNTRYAKQRIFEWYGAVPEALRRSVLEPIFGSSIVRRTPILKKGSSYIDQARVRMPDRLDAYNLLLRTGVTSVLTPRFVAAVDTQRPIASQRAVWDASTAESFVDRMLEFDWKYTLADNDLPKVIGTTELAGIDVGFPLLADELVEFSVALPPDWKVKRLKLRWFFKEALRDFLPAEIITKKKHGFGLPFGVWACNHVGLHALANDTVRGIAQRGIVSPAFAERLMAEYLPQWPGYYGEMVWLLMVLETWLRARAPDWRLQAA